MSLWFCGAYSVNSAGIAVLDGFEEESGLSSDWINAELGEWPFMRSDGPARVKVWRMYWINVSIE